MLDYQCTIFQHIFVEAQFIYTSGTPRTTELPLEIMTREGRICDVTAQFCEQVIYFQTSSLHNITIYTLSQQAYTYSPISSLKRYYVQDANIAFIVQVTHYVEIGHNHGLTYFLRKQKIHFNISHHCFLFDCVHVRFQVQNILLNRGILQFHEFSQNCCHGSIKCQSCNTNCRQGNAKCCDGSRKCCRVSVWYWDGSTKCCWSSIDLFKTAFSYISFGSQFEVIFTVSKLNDISNKFHDMHSTDVNLILSKLLYVRHITITHILYCCYTIVYLNITALENMTPCSLIYSNVLKKLLHKLQRRRVLP